MHSIKLKVPGQKQLITQAINSDNPMLQLKESILVSAGTRGDMDITALEIKNDDIVELVFDDDTKWLGPPDLLEDIYPGSVTKKRDGETVFELPTELDQAELGRSVFGNIALKVFNLFSKKKVVEKAVGEGMKLLARELEDKQLGKFRGLVKVSNNFELQKLEGVNTGNPILLFLHGTNSSTEGSFAELKGTVLWEFITRTYGNNILAFQHETLTRSPLQNVADMVKQLPANATLHLVSHSRGGLVGEVLCRFSGASGTEMGFSKIEMNLFEEENRVDDIDAINEIRKLYPTKKFIVKKFIRVACPSSGTTILSKRLDHFFNISLNLLGLIPGLAASPVYAAMKNLLIEVVDQKNDVHVLPGLEAMKPDSTFITVLNNQDNTVSISEPVVAISGNCKAKVNLKALVIIASKLFFAEDNDLVVNTKSMYNGSMRHDKLQFFFDEGTDVDHFSYFKNAKTNEAIRLALSVIGTGAITGFTEFSRGTLGEAQRNAILKLDGGKYTTGEPSGKRPIAILLPGIMGSNLTKDGRTLWIDYLQFLGGQLKHLSIDDTGIASSSLIKTSYKNLGEELQKDYDVVAFPFDWRLSLETSAGAFNKLIVEFLKLKQPIKIIGHSMGGVLVRDFMMYHPATWKILNESEGFRLLFLGSPLGGSFRINNVIFGEDDIISKLSKIDIFHTKRRLLEMFSKFPGLLCLLPFNKDADNDFSDPKLWAKMKDAFGEGKWPLPLDKDLKEFGTYRDKVLAATLDYSKAVYIAGQDKATPCGYRIDDTARGKELVFLSTAEGDQSVTWDMGIPKAMVDAGTVYYVNHTHGALSNAPDIFNGIKEILVKGETLLLSKNRPVVRGGQKIFKRPETSDFDLSPAGIERTLLGLPSEDKKTSSELPLKIKVSHGDMKYASYPLLAGHLKNDSILYAEARIDGLIKNLLSEQHHLGIYPGDIGTYEVFLTHAEGFPGAIIIGLGEPEKLTSFELTRSVEQGITKYLLGVNGNERIKNAINFKQPLGISSLIIACGYGGLSIENSISSILQGIVNANTKVHSLYDEKKQKALLIEEIEFVELYQDRALSCMNTLRRMSTESGGAFHISLVNNGLNELNGARRKMNLEDQAEWWNRITILREPEENKGAVKGMRFSISTGAAREDLRTIFTSTGIVEQLVEAISTDNNWTQEKARAIFELLIPNDFKSRLKKHGNIMWVLDKYTARFPWELLQDKSKDAKPISINAGMIRQLATGNSRLNIEAVTENVALVIGDPDLKGAFTQLPGALEEAKAVAEVLRAEGYETRELMRELPETIIPALVSKDYKIVHLAGHGIFNDDPDKASGMVLGKNSFITSAEIAQMSTTPELVFVNCCFLGKTDGATEQLFQSRFKLAANIGTQLIENGVKAVVVAGWAVDDAAALVFAKRFYECMFQGKAFGDAIRAARELVYRNFGNKNTWGAYQCYGDPFYKLRDIKWAKDEKSYIIPAQAEIDLSNLLSDMKCGDTKNETVLSKLKAITNEVNKQGIRTPAITELEAIIFKELNEYEKAIAKFEQLMACNDASYSVIAIEQYCNIRVKHLVKQKQTPAIEAAIEKVIADLNALISLGQSCERYSLLGSAWKRKILFSLTVKAKVLHAIIEAAKNYYLAYLADRKTDNVYAYTNWFSLENILVAAGEHKWGDDISSNGKTDYRLPLPAEISATFKAMKSAQAKKPVVDKYWDRIVEPNIELCTWMLSFTSGGKTPKTAAKTIDSAKVNAAYIKVWKMAGTKDQKQIEIDHLDLLEKAAGVLAPNSGLSKELKELSDSLGKAIS